MCTRTATAIVVVEIVFHVGRTEVTPMSTTVDAGLRREKEWTTTLKSGSTIVPAFIGEGKGALHPWI
jgi:hypothetical protein